MLLTMQQVNLAPATPAKRWMQALTTSVDWLITPAPMATRGGI